MYNVPSSGSKTLTARHSKRQMKDQDFRSCTERLSSMSFTAKQVLLLQLGKLIPPLFLVWKNTLLIAIKCFTLHSKLQIK